MKKYINPEINIFMFDIETVSTAGNAVSDTTQHFDDLTKQGAKVTIDVANLKFGF